MNVKEPLKFNVIGHFSIIDNNNNIVIAKKNLVVNTAKSIVANALAGGPSSDFISYISFGNPSGGATAPIITNTQLENQVHQVFVSYQSSTPPYFEDQDDSYSSTVVFSGVVDEDANFSATEAGLFSFKEFMFSRIKFNTITKSAGSTWLVKWKLEMSLS